MTVWQYATIFEQVADALGDAPAQFHGDDEVSWSTFDARADALAADLIDAGLTRHSKVGIYLYNDPAYLLSMFAAFKAALVPFNVNYRYAATEVQYLFENADAEAVVFHTSFAPIVEQLRDRLPLVRRWYAVEDDGPVPEWAVRLVDVVDRRVPRVVPAWGRSGDDYLMMYTGGTTGMPKGVMWTHGDLFEVLGSGGDRIAGLPGATTYEELAPLITGGAVRLPACPLMHGTGQFSALGGMVNGAAVCTMPSHHFDPAELLRTVDRRSVAVLIIVGDAFARPILAELEANRGEYDLSSLAVMVSSGVMWSQQVKAGLLEQIPQCVLFDSYGSSEAVGLGGSISAAGTAAETAKFTLGERVQVFTEDDRSVQPGSDEIGMVAIGGPQPLGYYKDEAKTAATFRTIGGVRYAMPGDYARVLADGTLQLLGRGSVCINTGGEKVFPEEVEEALKSHATVTDAVCVGIPDERFGETVCAVVEAANGDVDAAALIDHVKDRLAHYKAPRHVVTIDTIGRAPNGKVDFKRLRQYAVDRLGV